MIAWIGSRDDVDALQKRFRELRGPGGEWKMTVEHGAAFVSCVGLGLGAGEAVRGEAALDQAGVPLVALRTTPTSLIYRVASERCDEAVRALHGALVG